MQPWDELLESLDSQVYLTGEISSAGLEAIEAAQADGKSITLIQPAQRLRRAGFMAEEAWQLIREAADEENPFPADKVMPVYLNSPG